MPKIYAYKKKQEKVCTICGRHFLGIKSKNICSFNCKMEHNRQHALFYKQKIREGRKKEPCIVCGFSETTDRHEEGGLVYVLCPNHHCLITRGIKSLEEIIIAEK